MKLYYVTLKGMGGTDYGTSYVIAKNPEEAYMKVRKYLDDKDIGFSKDRELRLIELLAEDSNYPDIGTRLFVDYLDFIGEEEGEGD